MVITAGQPNAGVYYYHYDGLGSVIALSNSAGNGVEKYSYDVYGKPNAASSLGNPYLFAGREYDSETGNYYYRARYYSPKNGRFLQPDPIGYADSLNLYSYVSNNPLNWVDPLGLARVRIIIGRDCRGGNSSTTGSFIIIRDGKIVARGDTMEPRGGFYSIGLGKKKKHYPIPSGIYDARKGTFKGRYPNVEIDDVPGFNNIEIHRGNSVKDTTGCILVGTLNKKGDKLSDSKKSLEQITNNIKGMAFP